MATTDLPTHVALMGLMGSGKSSVGKVLARMLGRPLVDTDELILARTGMTVRQLWERGGEGAYRPLEREAVCGALASPEPSVIALPGGVVEDPHVRAELQARGALVVWLRAEVDTLLERVGAGGHRPLLGDDPRSVLVLQAEARAELHAQLADLVIDVGDRSPGDLAVAILSRRPG